MPRDQSDDRSARESWPGTPYRIRLPQSAARPGSGASRTMLLEAEVLTCSSRSIFHRSILGFGMVTNCAFSTYYQERRWRLYLPMLTSRQPCCRNFNWLAAKGRTLRVASLRDE